MKDKKVKEVEMGVHLKCPCGCEMEYNRVDACACGMYRLETVVIDEKNVVRVVAV